MDKENKSKVTPERAFLYGVGALVVGGAIYFTGKTLLKKDEENQPDDLDVNINVNESVITPAPRRLASGNDNFPLKYGSVGEKVKQLQEAVKRIIGENMFLQFTKVDGDFRSGTENALKAAKLPTVIDEVTFNRLVGGNTSSIMITTSPTTIGATLYAFATAKNFDGVISMLKQLKTVSEYSEANKAFISQQIFSVSKSIVTFLLDEAFKYNATAKAAIRSEFLRMGLKSSASDPINEDGKWSLSGFAGFKDIITLTDTYVLNKRGNRIRVSRNTILGEETGIKNGMTYFKSIDGAEHSVPTSHVKYTS